ncbi:MAG: DNA replication/repair protein RecF [Paracoccaceae bacterium]|nr:DNA replication/repair protein RecF [Paracoccaceae bacterium]
MTPLTVETLSLAQYRSYDLCTIETGGASVALYGPNGAGKTNILEALSMLVPGRGIRRAGIAEVGRKPGEMGWRVKARIAGPDGQAEVVTGTSAEGTGRRTVEIDGKAASQTALGRVMRMVWLTPAMDRLWTGPAADRRRFLDRMTLGFEPDHAETSLAYEKAMRGRNRLLREPGWDPNSHRAWLDGLEGQMARSGARIARARARALDLLSSAQDGAETAFPRAELAILGQAEARFAQALASGGDLDQTEAEEAADLAQRLAAGRPRDAAAGRSLDGAHRSDLEAAYAPKAMPASACSTGEQKALLISLCLANTRALAQTTGAAPVLLLDEVAAHLDKDRRLALYGEIEALGAQSWMTGTSDGLFEGLPGNALRLGVSEADGLSRIEGSTA